MTLRVLVIDDDPGVVAACEACIGGSRPSLEAEIAVAVSDSEALALLYGGRPFDIALVSVDGGAISGMRLFRRLVERSLRVPRIALTDGRDIGCLRTAIADGASDFLVKPITGNDLAPTLMRVMKKVQRRRRSWNERAAYMALRREVDIAADMQRRVLPSSFPRHPQLDFHAAMRPARGIGGDFYDVFEIDRERIGFLIADVSGKGIPAAFYMAVASTALRSVAAAGVPPGACLSEVNDFLVQRDILGTFVSVFYAVVHTSDWRMYCANAGHLPPLLAGGRGGPVRPVACEGGPVLGIAGGYRYGESAVALEPGATLVLYTDGVTEAWNGQRKLFGTSRLTEVIADAGGAPCRDLIDAIDTSIAAFVRDAEQHDDITALAARRRE